MPQILTRLCPKLLSEAQFVPQISDSTSTYLTRARQLQSSQSAQLQSSQSASSLVSANTAGIAWELKSVKASHFLSSSLNFYNLLPKARTQIWFYHSMQALSTRTKLEIVRNHLPRSSNELKNSRSTVVGNSRTLQNPSCSSYASIFNSRLVSIERAKQDEPSATSLALNNGGNRRQSNGEGFE
ncbi:hypothetical protein F511_31314 [Dorcoceras hygrometricum]|uniref:Uncharacterized protein n=1 Tax=Dorcoceras hygrometricum TaxID=472368 RepID=A0A2Z7DCX9_9LAMI|nr:hypothetical protein F511_31314 [Dorcoceras hygrometricum]